VSPSPALTTLYTGVCETRVLSIMVMISRRGSVELRSAKEGCEKGTVLYGQGQESRLRS